MYLPGSPKGSTLYSIRPSAISSVSCQRIVHRENARRAESISALDRPFPSFLARTLRILSRWVFLISSSTDRLFEGSDQTHGPCMTLYDRVLDKSCKRLKWFNDCINCFSSDW